MQISGEIPFKIPVGNTKGIYKEIFKTKKNPNVTLEDFFKWSLHEFLKEMTEIISECIFERNDFLWRFSLRNPDAIFE